MKSSIKSLIAKYDPEAKTTTRDRTEGRLYHLVAINERTGKRERLTSYPATHHEAVVMKSKFSPHRNVRIQLEEAIAKRRPRLSALEKEELKRKSDLEAIGFNPHDGSPATGRKILAAFKADYKKRRGYNPPYQDLTAIFRRGRWYVEALVSVGSRHEDEYDLARWRVEQYGPGLGFINEEVRD